MAGLPVDFQTSQSLELVRNKLRRTTLLLKSCASSAESLKTYIREISQIENAGASVGMDASPLMLELDQHIHVTTLHEAKVASLLDSTQSIDSLVLLTSSTPSLFTDANRCSKSWKSARTTTHTH
jgi:hypothetical protein